MIKLDYSLQTPEERNELVKKILEENPNPSERYLEVLTDYLILCLEKQEKKERKILTDNRLATINKRECSFEGLVSQLENGEDGIYNLISNSTQQIFQPKVTITKKDLEEIPLLNQLRETITAWEQKLKVTEGRDAFTIKKALIEMRKDQYVIKNAYRCPIALKKLIRSKAPVTLPDYTETLDADGFPIPQGISLMDPKICSAILCNYSRLKETCWDNFESDTWFLMYDFDQISSKALEPYPLSDVQI